MDDNLVTVRFMETERYDPMLDIEVVKLLAVTNKGTFHAEIPVIGPAPLRIRRRAFREHVMAALSMGEAPREVRLE